MPGRAGQGGSREILIIFHFDWDVNLQPRGVQLPEGVDVRREGSAVLVSTPDSGGFVSRPVAVKLGLISIGGVCDPQEH
jgi:hypothetical protein